MKMNKEDLKLLIAFFVDNNPTKIKNLLEDKQVFLDDKKTMVDYLVKMYEDNFEELIFILKNTPYNTNAKNYTTDPAVIELSSKRMSSGDDNSFKNIFDKIIGYLTGTKKSNETTVKQKGNIVLIVVILFFLLSFGGFLVYRLTK